MKCVKCGHPKTKVTDSRDITPAIKRRRHKCDLCGHKFNTYETIHLPSIVGQTARNNVQEWLQT
jgi:transcriptional regulator NrdR family protein